MDDKMTTPVTSELLSDERLAEMLAEVETERENSISDAEADQNPQILVDVVGEFDLSEMRSILTELRHLRASGGTRVKGLEWGKTNYGTPEAFSAVGVYRLNNAWSGGWSASWNNRVIQRPDGLTNFATEAEAKSAAQADYEQRILSALDMEQSSEPIQRSATLEGK